MAKIQNKNISHCHFDIIYPPWNTSNISNDDKRCKSSQFIVIYLYLQNNSQIHHDMRLDLTDACRDILGDPWVTGASRKQWQRVRRNRRVGKQPFSPLLLTPSPSAIIFHSPQFPAHPMICPWVSRMQGGTVSGTEYSSQHITCSDRNPLCYESASNDSQPSTQCMAHCTS